MIVYNPLDKQRRGTVLEKNPLKRQAKQIVGEALADWGHGRSDYAKFDECGSPSGLVTGAKFDPELYEDDDHPDVCTGRCSENRFSSSWIPVEEFAELADEEIEDKFAAWLFPAKEERPASNSYPTAKAELDAHNDNLQRLEHDERYGSPVDSTVVSHSSSGWIGRKSKLIVRGLVGHALLFK